MRARAFAFAAVVLCALCSVIPGTSRAAVTPDTYGEAYAKCQALIAGRAVSPGRDHWKCRDEPDYKRVAAWQLSKDEGAGDRYEVFPYAGTYDPCAGMQPETRNWVGQVSNGTKICWPNKQPDGSTVKCGMKFHTDGMPIKNPWGNWWTYGTFAPTGSLCGNGPGAGGGWEPPEGVPAPDVPPPAEPPKDPPPKDPPKVCGGLSCYDPGKNQFCAVSESGVQTCVPAPTPGASNGSSGSNGSCSTNGNITLCAGSPQAPAPPPKSVPDPPTQTRGTDGYTGGNPATGGVGNIGVGGYVNGGGTISNGAGPADTKPPAQPAGSGTSPAPAKDNTGASGGGDCNNPPFVSGSAALGMVATQAWQTRCAVDGMTAKLDKSLNGTGDAGDITTPSGTKAWVDSPKSPDAIAENANHGLYDSSGMGFTSTCPMHDVVVPLFNGKSFTVKFSEGCQWGDLIRLIVIAFGLYWAAKITAGGTA